MKEKETNDKKFVYTYSSAEEKRAEQLYKTYQLSEDRFETAETIDKKAVSQGRLVTTIVCAIGLGLIIFAAVCLTELDDIWFFPGLLVGISGIVNIVSGLFVGQLTVKLKRRLKAPDVLDHLKK